MLVVLGNAAPPRFTRYFNDLARHNAAIEMLPARMADFRSGEPNTELFPGDEAGFSGNWARLTGQPVTIIQSTAAPVGENCMQLLLGISTLKRYGAGSITVAMPFAAFGRQDRPFPDRFASVAGDDFPWLLKAAGADKIITAELHSDAAERFYTTHFGAGNVHVLSATSLFASHIKSWAADPALITVGAPDGWDKPDDKGQRRAKDLAAAAGISEIFGIVKRHVGVNETVATFAAGNVSGKTGIIVDDLSDSGGTLKNAGRLLKENDAVETWAYLTHPLLDKDSLIKLLTAEFQRASGQTEPVLDHLVVTDTVPQFDQIRQEAEQQDSRLKGRIHVLGTAPLFADRILRMA